ncbi:MAG: hypothetical protein WCC14_09290 [Acidobacteriaceae bacterium]
MTFELTRNRETNVAYVDACEMPPKGTRISVIDVTEKLGLKTQVLARMDESGVLLGLIIEDYSAFKREVRRKYLALAVERLLELIVSKVRLLTAPEAAPCPEHHQLAAHA